MYRYNEIISTEYSDVDKKITNCILDWFHKFENSLNGSRNWFEVSAKGLCDYKYCEGDKTLNWKNKGYQTVFSVLKVTYTQILIVIVQYEIQRIITKFSYYRKHYRIQRIHCLLTIKSCSIKQLKE